jgi:hypothetical protein
MRLDRDRWEELVELRGVTVPDILEKLKTGEFNDTVADVSVFLLGDQQGRLWAAWEYSYRLQRFSPAGRSLFELSVAGGRVQKKAESKGVEIRRSNPAQNPTEATRNPLEEKATRFNFTARQAILDFAEGRDRRLYLLVQQSDGQAALDRYDSVQGILERVPLQLKAQGRFTLAAGKDALYIAAWNGKQGRWRISWDLLDQASWQEVDQVSVDEVREKTAP